MIKVIALIGKAGSGKDTLMQRILAEPGYDFNEMISCTTRPRRDNEVDGKNYYFLTEQDFTRKVNNGLMLEYTEFNRWYYGTSLDSLDENKVNIGVFNPAGIRALCKHKDIDLTVFYIMASDKIRLIRQLTREQKPNVDEIIRRYGTDNVDFLGLGFPYTALLNEEEGDLEKNKQHILEAI